MIELADIRTTPLSHLAPELRIICPLVSRWRKDSEDFFPKNAPMNNAGGHSVKESPRQTKAMVAEVAVFAANGEKSG
jgi:hypothetical protein